MLERYLAHANAHDCRVDEAGDDNIGQGEADQCVQRAERCHDPDATNDRDAEPDRHEPVPHDGKDGEKGNRGREPAPAKNQLGACVLHLDAVGPGYIQPGQGVHDVGIGKVLVEAEYGIAVGALGDDAVEVDVVRRDRRATFWAESVSPHSPMLSRRLVQRQRATLAVSFQAKSITEIELVVGVYKHKGTRMSSASARS